MKNKITYRSQILAISLAVMLLLSGCLSAKTGSGTPSSPSGNLGDSSSGVSTEKKVIVVDGGGDIIDFLSLQRTGNARTGVHGS
mgnify:CR=1 FL=1